VEEAVRAAGWGFDFPIPDSFAARTVTEEAPSMNRIVVKSRVGGDGILQLTLPLGIADADQEVLITVEPVGPPAPSPDEWRRRILETAGMWQGEFERPEQGEYEQREPLA
jgi:hypothetical protein